MDNSLPVGAARIGQLYDDVEDTPHITAQLRRDSAGVHLELSLLADVTDYHADWFRTRQLPSFLTFRDTSGPVALTGLRLEGRNRSFASGLARGTIRVDHAVIGADVANYSSLDGLRSEIAGMALWSGLSSVTKDRAHTEEGRLRSFVITAESQDAVAVSDDDSVLFTPYFSVNLDDANGRTVIQEQILVETRARPAAPWDEHLRTHRALQDLLSLAYWHPCALRVTAAQRLDDPHRTMDGQDRGPRWLEAIVTRAGRAMLDHDLELPAHAHPLFAFSDIGPRGVSQWLQEYQTLGRPMWPLAALLFSGGTPVQADLLQVATALEALGHSIAGGTRHFIDYLLAAVGAVDPAVVGAICGSDARDWARKFNAAYKGVKHADNAATDPQVAWDMLTSGRLLIQSWLGIHLGADPGQLAQRVATAT